MTKARDLANAADVLDDVSATELSYVNGVTSAIQTQLNAKQATVANVNDTEIGYLDGVTSAIQTQIDGKSSTSHNHDSTYVANSLVDAKGDLLVGSANDTVSRLAVASTAGYVLTVDSAQATGLKWAAASSPTFVGVNVSKSANQTLSNATFTTITFDVEQFDTDGFHSNTTNTSRLTVPSGKAGKYLIVVAVRFGQENSTGYRNATILKNGSEFYETGFAGTGSVENQWGFSAIADLAVGDYIELACSQNSGGNLNILGTLAQRRTNIGMYLIGA